MDTTNHSSSSSLNLDGAEFEAITSCPSPENQPGNLRYVFLFCLAHFLHGIGATPLFTIGVSYIDENVGPAFSSYTWESSMPLPSLGLLWFSSFQHFSSLSHGFFADGQKFASILNLDETDPKWVGAWYLGFMLVSILALLAVFPILILPKVLPESLKWHRTRLQEETMGAKKRTPECCGMPSSSKTAVIAGSMIQLDDKSASVAVAESMPALKTRSGPIWYQLWLDVRHIPIAIYRILLNGRIC
uniref:Uncharacterized protein n=1 Tax=Ditylenchus dipsaci TaxID=166011 RepID=A0A915D269_9BILA